MKFSVVVPVYNGSTYLTALFDNLQAQGLARDDFEVVIVDDASTDCTSETVKSLSMTCDLNIKLIRHARNRHIGGARNTGIAESKGQYIMLLDCDDKITEGSLGALSKALSELGTPDILMYDSIECFGYSDVLTSFPENSLEVMTGRDYLIEQEIALTPCSQIYRRDFLVNNGLRYIENVSFEDTDFVIRALCAAAKAVYRPLLVYNHQMNESQTSFVGDDYGKIRDMFYQSARIREMAERVAETDAKLAKRIMGYHLYMHRDRIKRYLWRLDRHKALEVISLYPPYNAADDWMICMAHRYPKMLCLSMAMLRPLLQSMRAAYRRIKGRDIR